MSKHDKISNVETKKLTLFNHKEITQYVTNSKDTLYRGHFHKDSIYSEQIFGPVVDYTCQCGTYSNSGGRCPKCGVQFTESIKRLKQSAKIKLLKPVINPFFLWYINTKRPSTYYEKMITDFMNYRSYLILMDDDFEILDMNFYNSKNINSNIYTGAQAAKVFTDLLIKLDRISDIPKRIYNKYLQYKSIFLIDSIIVIPPFLRPAIISGKTIFTAELNRQYSYILKKIEKFNNLKYINTNINPLTIKSYISIQYLCNNIYKLLLEVFKGKKGLFRGNMLGKRIDMSGRAVITPDPSINFDECKISYYILLEVYKYHVIRLVMKTENKIFFDVLEDIERCLKEKDLKYMNYLEQVTKGEVVLLNRQPTLHKHGIQGFYIKITPDYTIKIHPMVCSAFNADFDGDQMACYFFLTEEAKADVKEKALISKNLFLEGNGDLAIMPNQDIVYGIYLLSKTKEGRKILPKELIEYMVKYKLKSITSKHLINFMSKYLLNFSSPSKVKIIDNIKKLGLTAASKAETTISLQDIIDSTIIEEDKKELNNLDTLITNEDVDKFLTCEADLLLKLKKICCFTDFIESGSRGSWSQAKQIFLSRGMITNSVNDIQSKAITHSLVDGLDSREIFLSCYGVRKGLADIADNTARSGSFTRSLIYLANNALLSKEFKPCKTKNALEIKITDKDIAKSLVGRYIFPNRESIEKNEMILLDNINIIDYIGKTVLLRSPIFCTSKDEYCPYCAPYKTKKNLNRKQNYHIGIIAAQSLGERATQLVLRAFHMSGMVIKKKKKVNKEIKNKIKNDKMKKNEDITSDLNTVTKMFTNSKEFGLIDINEISKYINQLFSIYKPHGILKLLHFELLASCMMWITVDDTSETYEPWRNHQDSKIETYSIYKVPQLQSWLVSCAFGNFKRKILNSLDKPIGNSLFDKILSGTL